MPSSIIRYMAVFAVSYGTFSYNKTDVLSFVPNGKERMEKRATRQRGISLCLVVWGKMVTSCIRGIRRIQARVCPRQGR